MSVGPIDLQAVIASAKEVERAQNTGQARHNVHAQGFSVEMEQRLEHEAKSVRKVDQHETRNVDRDGRQKGREEQPRKQRSDRQDGDEDVRSEPLGEIYDPQAGVHHLAEEQRHNRETTI